MKKYKIRDLIYICRDSVQKYFYSYGIEFFEFMKSVPKPPKNLILLQHHFNNALWNRHSNFEYVTGNEIEQLIDDDVYGYGNFCWVDFEDVDELNRLSDKQIAELLFFSHMAKPLNRIPMNRFAYYAHDDGWFNKLFVHDLRDYESLLSNVIISKLELITRRTFAKMPTDITSKLLDYTREGLFIDLSRIVKTRVKVKVPITAIGHYTEMDKIYDFREDISDYRIFIEYSDTKKSWQLLNEG